MLWSLFVYVCGCVFIIGKGAAIRKKKKKKPLGYSHGPVCCAIKAAAKRLWRLAQRQQRSHAPSALT